MLKAVVYQVPKLHQYDTVEVTCTHYYKVLSHRPIIQEYDRQSINAWFEFDDETVTEITEVEKYLSNEQNQRNCYYCVYVQKDATMDE